LNTDMAHHWITSKWEQHMYHPQISNFVWILVRGKETCCILPAWNMSHYHNHGLWPNNSRIHITGRQHWRLSHVGCLVGYCCHKLWQITPWMVVLGCCKKNVEHLLNVSIISQNKRCIHIWLSWLKYGASKAKFFNMLVWFNVYFLVNMLKQLRKGYGPIDHERLMCHYFLLFINPFCHHFNYWLALIIKLIMQFYHLGLLD